MKYRKILRWVARAALLFLSFCGIATLITNATDPTIQLESRVIEVSWVFGVGGLLLFVLSFTKLFGRKK